MHCTCTRSHLPFLEITYSRYLFYTRENFLFSALGKSLQEGMSAGKDIFQIWMLEQSDLVQASARAFGEKLIVDEFMRVVEEASADSELHSVLKSLLTCYIWYIIEKVTNNSSFMNDLIFF